MLCVEHRVQDANYARWYYAIYKIENEGAKLILFTETKVKESVVKLHVHCTFFFQSLCVFLSIIHDLNVCTIEVMYSLEISKNVFLF